MSSGNLHSPDRYARLPCKRPRIAGDAGLYRFCVVFDIFLVGTGVLDGPKKTGRRRRRPLPVCAIFVILVVGATSGRPSFIKIALRFARVAEDVDPYRFGGFLNLMPVGKDIILPCLTIPPSFSCENATSLYTREALVWFSFYYLVSSFLIVGTDVLDGPKKWVVEGSNPYRFVRV